MNNSLFITLEGGEGSGKSFQAEVLYKKLLESGLSVVLTHEPGGTPFGEKITSLLKWGKEELSPLTEMLLFNASRAQLIDTVIKPALSQGSIVICDRFVDSTLVYQGYSRGLEESLVQTVNDAATDGISPDLSILLDIPVEQGLARKSDETPDRFQRENLAFHRRVRNGFLKNALREPQRWLYIDATQSKDRISQIIWQKVNQLLSS